MWLGLESGFDWNSFLPRGVGHSSSYDFLRGGHGSRGKESVSRPAALSPERTPNSAELRASDARTLEICVQLQSALCLRGSPTSEPKCRRPWSNTV